MAETGTVAPAAPIVEPTFDVAISFLVADEKTASEIKAGLAGLNVFLFRMACALIRKVSFERSIIIDHWTLGGGTAMMLQIDHRESHDIDIFFPDPQLLPFS